VFSNFQDWKSHKIWTLMTHVTLWRILLLSICTYVHTYTDYAVDKWWHKSRLCICIFLYGWKPPGGVCRPQRLKEIPAYTTCQLVVLTNFATYHRLRSAYQCQNSSNWKGKYACLLFSSFNLLIKISLFEKLRNLFHFICNFPNFSAKIEKVIFPTFKKEKGIL